jgi:hypothetical protein
MNRTSYLVWATGSSLVLVFVVVFVVVFVLVIAGVVSLGDFTLESPASLGHPAEQVRLEEAARVDLGSLGLDWIGNETITQLDGTRVGSGAKAFRVEYSGEEEQVFLSMIEFDSTEQSDSFFSNWREAHSNIRVTEFEINPPGLLGQGRILRFYSPQTGRAYNAWQNENWVRIIEVPGPFSQASPLAREVKELVAKHYDEGS